MLQPGRNLTAGLLVVTFVVICVCLHLMTELSHLDGARLKLEKAVSKLQESNLPVTRRRLSSSDDQISPSFGDDDTVVIYNRVPKTGSTTMAGFIYTLCVRNKYHVIHLNMVHAAKTIGLSDQMRFFSNITLWQERKPALYHGHVAFIDYTKFGIVKKPIYINLIRNPLDRLVSFYYFIRYGDDIRGPQQQKKERAKDTFDECVEQGGEDCNPDNLWLQIPYFCGHVAECWKPGSEWALKTAKLNVLRYYLVVGVTEQMEDFIIVLETVLPRFFKGSVHLYRNGKGHLRKTSVKHQPKPETVAKIQESPIWKMENEFYEFVRDHFRYLAEQLFETDEDGDYIEKGHRFMYEKIRPV